MGNGAQGVLDVDWLNSNSQRRYPLSEEASLRDTTGSFSIPNDFIVDLLWPVHADSTVDPRLFHVAGIAVFGPGVTVSIGYNGVVIGTASIDAVNFARNNVYFIQGTGKFFDTVGKIVIGSLETVRKTAGSYLFSVANAGLEQTVIRPDIRGVSALYFRNGSELSEPFQNDVILQAGARVLFNVVKVLGEPDRIVVNAIDGLNLNEDCSCGENQDLPCVQTINGLGPDPDGNFLMLDDDCLKLRAITNGLQLQEQCAKPCCGCDELLIIQQTAEYMVQQIARLENMATQLENAIVTTQITCLGAK